jgi:hypothetical protein
MRKQVDGPLDPWDHLAEPGDRVVDGRGRVYDLRESRGRDKRDAGDLTPVLAAPQRSGARAVEVDGIWYWERQ